MRRRFPEKNNEKKQSEEILKEGYTKPKSEWGENGHTTEERGMTNQKNV